MQSDLSMPAPVARYFGSNTAGPSTAAQCFAEDAIVIDEGHEHRGRSAITAWRAASIAKYQFTTEPLSSEVEAQGVLTVIARVTGTFPGSPVELRFRFTLEAELIARLEISA